MLDSVKNTQQSLFESWGNLGIELPGQPQVRIASALRDKGIKKAVDHANKEVDKWSDKAYLMLLEYLKTSPGQFMTEQFRAWCDGRLEEPPHLRAFGGIIAKAAKKKLIKKAGHGTVINPNAHCCFASVWEVI
ncbi:MAG TPA: hypothetical protein ACFYEK_01245 [Candidatus Wunengus sp. YC60]|uniref:hypothetical protein n=1 Tax=Candidatus Wunengus sp. YC60 TaxID=3367697 RepID=UPI0040276989